MKSHIHDIVRRLLELHGLEERLAALKRDPDERANAEASIESLRANLPMGVRMVHDQMRSREKRSVAEVRHGVCAGCHLTLGVGNVAAVRTGEMRRCGNCGRYVYLVLEPKSSTPESERLAETLYRLGRDHARLNQLRLARTAAEMFMFPGQFPIVSTEELARVQGLHDCRFACAT